MKASWVSIYLCLAAAFYGCSNEAFVTGEFHLEKGASIYFRTDFRAAYRDSALYFTLYGVPGSKQDRDFSDFIGLELIDEKGHSYQAEKIWDINGQKRDIVAVFHNLPKGTRIRSVKLVARNQLQGSKIRWWTGRLK